MTLDSTRDAAPSAAARTVTAATVRSMYGKPRVAICDTDYLMNQVRNAVNTPGAVPFPGVHQRVYASQHVFDELYGDDGHGHPTKWHKLSDQARDAQTPVAADVFQVMFERSFLPGITFVDMGGLFAEHPLAQKVQAVRNGKGASDVPTAQLAILLSRMRPVTYSHDQHLYKPGVAPRPRNFSDVCAAEGHVSRGEHLAVGVGHAVFGTLKAADFLVQQVGTLISAPVWLGRAAMIGVGALAFTSTQRRSRAAQVVSPILEALTGHLEGINTGLTVLDGAAIQVEPETALEARIAQVLVKESANGPLLAGEILEHLAGDDQSAFALPSMDELRSVLVRTPCFEEGPRWRYGLGHQYRRL